MPLCLWATPRGERRPQLISCGLRKWHGSEVILPLAFARRLECRCNRSCELPYKVVLPLGVEPRRNAYRAFMQSRYIMRGKWSKRRVSRPLTPKGTRLQRAAALLLCRSWKMVRHPGNDPRTQVWKTHMYPLTPMTQNGGPGRLRSVNSALQVRRVATSTTSPKWRP